MKIPSVRREISHIGDKKIDSDSNSGYEDRSIEPFIGPRPFKMDEEDQLRFFGRDAEANEIVSLITSHRNVLIYAQSGAGKTSIFNAQVISSLIDHGFDVLLPMARVHVTSPSPISPYDSNNKFSTHIENIYIHNALQVLRPDVDPKSIGDFYLFEFLDKYFPTRKDENGELVPQVLIFDQLEEIFSIFSFYPDNWVEQQKDFFEQVADALDNNPVLRVVFIIREDFLAQLEPFRSILPEKLGTRFRLERLRKEQAKLAIKGPLKNAVESLSKKDLQEIELEINGLVDDLLNIYIEKPDGGTRVLPGEFIEPIQLQVVCKRWWHERNAAKRTENKPIKMEELRKVDIALEGFYEDAIHAAELEQTVVSEGEIRKWCEDKLITSSGTRSIVHRDEKTKTTEGINNNIVDSLAGKYLLRKEQRAGGSWYELTHDRLIKPIKQSNERWKTEKRRKRKGKVIIAGSTAAAVVVIVAVTGLWYLYYSNQLSDSFATYVIAVGEFPYGVAVNPITNMTYVANFDSDSVSVIDEELLTGNKSTISGRNSTQAGQGNNAAVGHENIKDFPVVVSPYGVAVNPFTNMTYVTSYYLGTVSVIDGRTNSLVGNVTVGDGPTSVAVNPFTNLIYVANFNSNTVSVINGTTNNVVRDITVGGQPQGVAVNPNTNMTYVTNDLSDTVSVIDGRANSLVGNVTVGDGPTGLAVNPNTNTIYVANFNSNTVSVIDGRTNEIVRTMPGGNGPIDVAVNPNTNTIYVSNSNDNTLLILAPKTPQN